MLAESAKLPPTAGSLEQHIERVGLHVQATVWPQDMVMRRRLLDPLKHSYY